jgi:hypothetical protein
VADHIRSVHLNLRVTPRIKQQITELAMAQKLSMTELLMRAFDAYAAGPLDFTPDQHHILSRIAKELNITLSGAVEYALKFGIVPLGLGAEFFKTQIEPSPGDRLAHEDLLAAFHQWCRSLRFRFEEPSAHSFARMGLVICRCKGIDVRVRDNKVVCVGVRLRHTA